jgi:hypothetical protein
VKGEDELRREGRSGGWVEKLEPRAIMRRSRVNLVSARW